MVLWIRAFMPWIKIMQLNELSEVKDGPILTMFLVMLKQIPEFHSFVQKLTRSYDLKG